MRFLFFAGMLAQTDMLGSGWFADLGRWGLLAAVLGWLLLKHLPDKDKIIRDLTALHAKTEEDQRKTHSDLERAQRAEYQDALLKILGNAKEMVADVASMVRPEK